MASIISAGTTSGTALNMAGDTSGVLQLATNGSTTAITVDTSQNVGIGTASPTTRLDLSVPLNSGVRVSDGTSSGVFYASGHATNSIVIGSTTNVPVAFFQNNTERMRIDTSGNVKVDNGDLILNNDKSVNFGNGTDTFNRISLNSGIGELELRGYAGFRFYTPLTSDSVARMSLNSSGNLTIFGSTATKASGTTWANPSDIRLKDNIQDFNKGLTELLQVNVKTWEYNGKGGTTEGTKGIGVIADEIQTVLPETVDTYKAKLNIDDTEETDIKRFDATEITWLLVNAIQEQQTIINDLKARITALEGAA
jgi:hypothetical protein